MGLFWSSRASRKGTSTKSWSSIFKGLKRTTPWRDPPSNTLCMTAKDRHFKLYIEDIQLSMTRILEYAEGMDLDNFEKKWNHKYAYAVKSWKNNWYNSIYNQYYREPESWDLKVHNNKIGVPAWPGCHKIGLPGYIKYRKKMDHANPELGHDPATVFD